MLPRSIDRQAGDQLEFYLHVDPALFFDQVSSCARWDELSELPGLSLTSRLPAVLNHLKSLDGRDGSKQEVQKVPET